MVKFKKGDLLHIHTDSVYQCIIADVEIAVFAQLYDGSLLLQNLRVRDQKGKTAKVCIDESDMIKYFEDIAYKNLS